MTRARRASARVRGAPSTARAKAVGASAAEADGGRSLAGMRCLVTGGGTGIGAGIARRLAAQGAAVALLGRRPGPLREVAAALRASGAVAATVRGDVTDERSVARAVDEAAKALGGLDVVVNNAGAGGPNRCALPGPERWDVVVRTNLDGTFFTTRAALRHLADGGRVVNVSSVLGRFGVPGYTAYCASKHGVIGFTKALALELAPRRITVNAICPGWVETDMARGGMELLAKAQRTSYAKARAMALAQVPLGRMLEPDEIGDWVAWLCSAGASGTTGQAIVVDGGQVMW